MRILNPILRRGLATALSAALVLTSVPQTEAAPRSMTSNLFAFSFSESALISRDILTGHPQPDEPGLMGHRIDLLEHAKDIRSAESGMVVLPVAELKKALPHRGMGLSIVLHAVAAMLFFWLPASRLVIEDPSAQANKVRIGGKEYAVSFMQPPEQSSPKKPAASAVKKVQKAPAQTPAEMPVAPVPSPANPAVDAVSPAESNPSVAPEKPQLQQTLVARYEVQQEAVSPFTITITKSARNLAAFAYAHSAGADPMTDVGDSSILHVAFPDIRQLSEAMDRLSVFAEHRQYKGKVLTAEEMDDVFTSRRILRSPDFGKRAAFRTGHDVSMETVAQFFTQAKVLNKAESDLLAQLIGRGSLIADGAGYRAAKTGALIATPDSLPPLEKERILRHEMGHGLYFTDPLYRLAVESIWNSLSETDRNTFRQLFHLWDYDESVFLTEFAEYLEDSGQLKELLEGVYDRSSASGEEKYPAEEREVAGRIAHEWLEHRWTSSTNNQPSGTYVKDSVAKRLGQAAAQLQRAKKEAFDRAGIEASGLSTVPRGFSNPLEDPIRVDAGPATSSSQVRTRFFEGSVSNIQREVDSTSELDRGRKRQLLSALRRAVSDHRWNPRDTFRVIPNPDGKTADVERVRGEQDPVLSDELSKAMAATKDVRAITQAVQNVLQSRSWGDKESAQLVVPVNLGGETYEFHLQASQVHVNLELRRPGSPHNFLRDIRATGQHAQLSQAFQEAWSGIQKNSTLRNLNLEPSNTETTGTLSLDQALISARAFLQAAGNRQQEFVKDVTLDGQPYQLHVYMGEGDLRLGLERQGEVVNGWGIRIPLSKTGTDIAAPFDMAVQLLKARIAPARTVQKLNGLVIFGLGAWAAAQWFGVMPAGHGPDAWAGVGGSAFLVLFVAALVKRLSSLQFTRRAFVQQLGMAIVLVMTELWAQVSGTRVFIRGRMVVVTDKQVTIDWKPGVLIEVVPNAQGAGITVPDGFDFTPDIEQEVRQIWMELLKHPRLTDAQRRKLNGPTSPATDETTPLGSFEDVMTHLRQPPVEGTIKISPLKHENPVEVVTFASEADFLRTLGDVMLWWDLAGAERRPFDNVMGQIRVQLKKAPGTWPSAMRPWGFYGAHYTVQKLVDVHNAYERTRTAAHPVVWDRMRNELMAYLKARGYIEEESISPRGIVQYRVVKNASLLFLPSLPSDEVRSRVLVHEGFHAAMTGSPALARGVEALWNSLTSAQRQIIAKNLSAGYRVLDDPAGTPAERQQRRALLLQEFGAYGLDASNASAFESIPAEVCRTIEATLQDLTGKYAAFLPKDRLISRFGIRPALGSDFLLSPLQHPDTVQTPPLGAHVLPSRHILAIAA